MSGSAVNRGGVRVEFHADIDDPNFRWWAKMRNHGGHGASADAALDHLVAEIEDELRRAKAGRDTFRDLP